MKLKRKMLAVGLFAFLAGLLTSQYLEIDRFMPKQKPFQIQMKVDFGPANKPVYDQMITVERGTTPKEAVSQVFPVLSGVACCSFRDVIEIGGVKINPAKNMWWTCALNGSKKISPQKKKLKPGDRVEWKYIQDAQ